MGSQALESISFKILPVLQKIQQDHSHKLFSVEGLSQTQILTFVLFNFMSEEV